MSEKDKGNGAGPQFVDAVRSFVQAQHEIAEGVQQRTTDATRELARAVQEAQQGAGGGYTATNLQEAVRDYPSAVQDAQQRWQEVVNAYHEAVGAATQEAGERQEKALRAYIADVQAAWAQVDPSTISLADIAAIQQATAAAACVPAGQAT
jgi:gas vesicle protein